MIEIAATQTMAAGHEKRRMKRVALRKEVENII